MSEQEHEHTFLTLPGRCIFCGLTSEEARQQELHRMLTEAFNRLADVLERVERKLGDAE